MKVLLTNGQYFDLLELDGSLFYAPVIPTGVEFLSMPENEKVYPDVENVECQEEQTIEVDEAFYLIDTVNGEHCPKIVGGRPRNIVRRK